MSWKETFDGRQRKEIEFSQVYAANFAHGTDGHTAKLIIAEMSNLLSEVERIIQDPRMNEREVLKYLANFFNL